ncbi:hypothetical protein N7520_009618 [Penicillium odoratum]|uniref:uncharacterized protein n=1 Tax=Penicillium odoratum TaxID=1167516 RepID=UPI002546617E|nr:uncharacterized protein N7520_009618 [Penicillium odoratum]KAJ5752701.1 hypothetical protein N7520_009618 [Penicillium odoratum]
MDKATHASQRESLLRPAPLIFEPPLRDDDLWGKVNTRIRQIRRSRSHPGAHRVKLLRSDKRPARIAPTQALYAGNASVASSASVKSSVSAANSSSAGPSTTAGSSPLCTSG